MRRCGTRGCLLKAGHDTGHLMDAPAWLRVPRTVPHTEADKQRAEMTYWKARASNAEAFLDALTPASYTEEDVERVAEALYDGTTSVLNWADVVERDPRVAEEFRRAARAALDAFLK